MYKLQCLLTRKGMEVEILKTFQGGERFKKTDVAVIVASERQVEMKAMYGMIGIVCSNVAGRIRGCMAIRRGRPLEPDANPAIAIEAIIGELPPVVCKLFCGNTPQTV